MDADDLAFAGVARQAELLRAGEVSARELVQTYLDRIERLNPRLNAYRIVYAESALAEADGAQERLKAGDDDRPLLGVPVAIKDNTDVAGDVTTHGTRAYGEPAREDAEVVRRVREAGAIVLGRTHVPELCIWPFTQSATWGMTRNPWNTEHTPGGSSGGSGAAVAAGLAPGALGSDGGGSIRVPAAFCGLFGLKPQRGRISTSPLPDHWYGLSVFGWLARRVIDSALLYDATIGATPTDADAAPPPPRPYAEAARTSPGKLRIAVSTAVPPGAMATVGAEPAAAVRDMTDLLRALGHEVRERDPDFGLISLNASARYLRGLRDEAVTLAHPDRLERRTRAMVRMGAMVPPGAVARARAAEAGQAARINELFADHDVLLTPVTSSPPPEHGHWEGLGALSTLNAISRHLPYTVTWNATGQPAAAVPAGPGADGLPRAVQFVARPNDESTLFSLAAQIEADSGWPDERPPVS